MKLLVKIIVMLWLLVLNAVASQIPINYGVPEPYSWYISSLIGVLFGLIMRYFWFEIDDIWEDL